MRRRNERSPIRWSLVATAAMVLGVTPAAAGQVSAAASGSATTAPAFTATKTIERVHLDSTTGATVVDDQRTFSVSVSETFDLRDHQVIQVSWTGAHPMRSLPLLDALHPIHQTPVASVAPVFHGRRQASGMRHRGQPQL